MNNNQKKELKFIMSNPASYGAFSGMIFNAYLKYPSKDTKFLIEQALDVRLKIKELVEE